MPLLLTAVIALAASNVLIQREQARTLATGSADRLVRLWDATTWTLRRDLPEHAALVLGVAFSPDGRSLAPASGDFYLKEHRGELRVRDVGTGGLRHRLHCPTESVFCVTFSPDGRRPGVTSGKAVRVWGARAGRLLRTLRGHPDYVITLAFSRRVRDPVRTGRWPLSTGPPVW